MKKGFKKFSTADLTYACKSYISPYHTYATKGNISYVIVIIYKIQVREFWECGGEAFHGSVLHKLKHGTPFSKFLFEFLFLSFPPNSSFAN